MGRWQIWSCSTDLLPEKGCYVTEYWEYGVKRGQKWALLIPSRKVSDIFLLILCQDEFIMIMNRYMNFRARITGLNGSKRGHSKRTSPGKGKGEGGHQNCDEWWQGGEGVYTSGDVTTIFFITNIFCLFVNHQLIAPKLEPHPSINPLKWSHDNA